MIAEMVCRMRAACFVACACDSEMVINPRNVPSSRLSELMETWIVAASPLELPWLGEAENQGWSLAI